MWIHSVHLLTNARDAWPQQPHQLGVVPNYLTHPTAKLHPAGVSFASSLEHTRPQHYVGCPENLCLIANTLQTLKYQDPSRFHSVFEKE